MSDQETKTPAEAGFINRWSARKRKHATVTESNAETNSVIAGSTVNLETDHSETKSNILAPAESSQHADAAVPADTQTQDPAPLLSDDDMPSIASLDAKSDLSNFFNKGVSAGLRRAALRHVFQLPIYNERDGLNDYDDDFTKFEPLGDTVTSDMKWHKARKEREAEEAAAEQRAAEEQAQRERDEAEERLNEEQGEAQEQSQQDQLDAETADASSDQNETEASQPDTDQLDTNTDSSLDINHPETETETVIEQKQKQEGIPS